MRHSFNLLLKRNCLSSLVTCIYVSFSNLKCFYEVESRAKIVPAKSDLRVMGDPVKFVGVSEEVHKILDANMDQVGPRRRAREAFKDIQLSINHILFKVVFL